MVIYKITNLINNKIYIGKTINDSDDYYGSGILIKRAINKYGKNNFKKEIIDIANSLDDLNIKEKYWINENNSTDLTIGYNISDGGDGGDLITNNPNKEKFLEYCRQRKGDKNGMFRKKHSLESLKKMSNNRKGKGKQSTWNKGLTKDDYSDEYLKKLGRVGEDNPQAKKYHIISPTKDEYSVYGGLDKFAIKHNLSPTTFRYYVGKGIIPPSSRKCSEKRNNLTGWQIDEVKTRKKLNKKAKQKLKIKCKERLYGENNLNAKVFYLISPKGEIHKTNGILPEFCRQNNLNVNVLRNYLNKGKVPPTNREKSKIRENTTGWELKTDLSIVGKYNKYYYELTSPKGDLYTIKHGLRIFCKEHNLNYDCLILNKNKGKIKPSKICFTEERINTTGWEMIKIDPNVI